MPAGIALYGRPVQHTDDQELSWPTEYFLYYNKYYICKLMWQSINLEGCQDETQMLPVPMKVGMITTSYLCNNL
jgi:hypothetical protein